MNMNNLTSTSKLPYKNSSWRSPSATNPNCKTGKAPLNTINFRQPSPNPSPLCQTSSSCSRILPTSSLKTRLALLSSSLKRWSRTNTWISKSPFNSNSANLPLKSSTNLRHWKLWRNWNNWGRVLLFFRTRLRNWRKKMTNYPYLSTRNWWWIAWKGGR